MRLLQAAGSITPHHPAASAVYPVWLILGIGCGVGLFAWLAIKSGRIQQLQHDREARRAMRDFKHRNNRGSR